MHARSGLAGRKRPSKSVYWQARLLQHHGIYDTAIGAVRKVEPNIDLGMVWSYQTNFLSISSLEDVMGGHAVLAFILTIGGVWHIITSPFGPFKKILIYSNKRNVSVKVCFQRFVLL
jgi:hypothetical protein